MNKAQIDGMRMVAEQTGEARISRGADGRYQLTRNGSGLGSFATYAGAYEMLVHEITKELRA